MPRPVLPVCAILWIAGLLTAQSPTRGVFAGRVLDRERKPVAGAELVVLHRALPASLECTDFDAVRATTNDAGMFRVGLLEGRAYSAWARWPDGATRMG